MSVASSQELRERRHDPAPPDGYPKNSAPPVITTSSVKTVSFAQQQLGASVTDGMRKAFADCEAAVKRIAAQCRAKNRKYRDVDFDLENDTQRCLHNLSDDNVFVTADVRRVADIFENPIFYSGTPKSAEVVQGAVEDCYLVSALSAMTSVDRLVKNLCVARDEHVGVYGFLFYRDCYWVPVIIDDLLFTRVPKWEQLSTNEKELYHFEKEKYNKQARKGSESLCFARPSTDGETWVPLVEKAYSKMHGDYASVMYGRTCDAIEDMTGGVSVLLLTKDILDPDKFWTDELSKANEDRLFGCWFKSLDGARSGVKNATVDGLVGNLSHSIVRAVEVRGKRFVVMRDPWGDASWNGPWSNGSKEWTAEWLSILPELQHSFNGNGQFVMEYKDFLNVWQEIQRTLLFDDTWVMSSQWLHVSLPFPPVSAISFGDISFTFSLPVKSRTVIVFCHYNTRFFKDIKGPCVWNLNFILAKEGETVPLAESSYSFFYSRSVTIEEDLDAGNYIVLGRLDPTAVRDKDYFKKGLNEGWNRRKLARIMTERAKGQSIASNYKPSSELLPVAPEVVLRGERIKNDKAAMEALKTHGGYIKPGENITIETTTSTTQVISKSSHAKEDPLHRRARPAHHISADPNPGHGHQFPSNNQAPAEPGWSALPPTCPRRSRPQSPAFGQFGGQGMPPPPPLDLPRPPSPPTFPLPPDVLEEDNSIVVGLKVFTNQTAPTVITGRLREHMTGMAQQARMRYT